MASPAHRLIVMRHAHAAPSGPGVADHDRPLTRRGRDAARMRGAVMEELSPQLVRCSSALRAVQTVEELGLSPDLPRTFDERVYAASAGGLILVSAETDQDVSAVLLVGHLPAVADMVRALIPPAQRGGLGFAPATIAVLDVDVAWADLGPGTARLVRLIR